MATHARRPAVRTLLKKTTANKKTAVVSRARTDSAARSAAADTVGSVRPSRERRARRARRRPPSGPRPADRPMPLSSVDSTAAAAPRALALSEPEPVVTESTIASPELACDDASISSASTSAPIEAPAAITPEPGNEAGDQAKGPVDFPAFVDALIPPPTRAVFSPGGRLDPARLVAIQALFETVVRESAPLPAHAAHLAGEISAQFAYMQDLVSGRVSPPTDTPRLFDWRVCYLLALNYWHAVETAGRATAKAELMAMVKTLTRGRKGRRATITVSQVQEALRLWEQDVTPSEIARRVGLKDGHAVRTALKHYFPDRFPGKKSR